MKGICEVCGQPKIVYKNKKSGKIICQNCCNKARYRDPSTHEPCSECGKRKPVRKRNEFGKAICHNCYRRTRYRNSFTHYGLCLECRKVKRIKFGEAICYSCQEGKVGVSKKQNSQTS